MSKSALNSKHLKPSKAAAYLNVSKITLRRWEKQGILSPDRTPGGHRTYSKQELDQAKVTAVTTP